MKYINNVLLPLLMFQSSSGTCSNKLYLAFPGDGVDNDCDGQVDEDLCYGNDTLEFSNLSA